MTPTATRLEAAIADLPDLNVWLALAWGDHPHHGRAVAYWERDAAREVLFCSVTALGHLRLLTQPKVMGPATLTASRASAVLLGFTELAGVAVVDGGAADWEVFHGLLARQSLASQGLTDGYLAAKAIAHGWRLVSFDQGFGRFEGLLWLRP